MWTLEVCISESDLTMQKEAQKPQQKQVKNTSSDYREDSYFSPASWEDHEKANNGEGVRDKCIYCGNEYTSHFNGRCPK